MRSVGLDSSTAVAADTQSRCKISKIRQKSLIQNFENLFHVFCILANACTTYDFRNMRKIDATLNTHIIL